MLFSSTIVEVAANFSKDGSITPLRVNHVRPDGKNVVFNIVNVTSRTVDKFAGNNMIEFVCEFMDGDLVRIIRIKYELDSLRWFLMEIK